MKCLIVCKRWRISATWDGLPYNHRGGEQGRTWLMPLPRLHLSPSISREAKTGRGNMRYRQLLLPLATAAMFLGAGSAFSQTVEDFYKGKTVRIVVGNSAGGGSDLN